MLWSRFFVPTAKETPADALFIASNGNATSISFLRYSLMILVRDLHDPGGHRSDFALRVGRANVARRLK